MGRKKKQECSIHLEPGCYLSQSVYPQPVWIGFTRDDVISAIIKAMTRRYEILVKHGMEPYRAQRRVPRELEKSLNRLMKSFVFPEEMGSEARLDDLDEDGE